MAVPLLTVRWWEIGALGTRRVLLLRLFLLGTDNDQLGGFAIVGGNVAHRNANFRLQLALTFRVRCDAKNALFFFSKRVLQDGDLFRRELDHGTCKKGLGLGLLGFLLRGILRARNQRKRRKS